MTALLELNDVHACYAHIRALQGLDLECGAGKIVAVLGPNGAGKSTVLKAAFGLVPASEGFIRWRGEIVRPEPSRMVEAGLSFAPQGKSVFPNLTVRENLEAGVHFLRDRQDINSRLDEAFSLFPALEDKWNIPAGALSGGQQQMVVLARGLMARPKLLLLDEPSLGLAPRLVREVFLKIKEINQRLGTAFIIVEHNLKSLLHVVDHAYVLNRGRVEASGPPSDAKLQDLIVNLFKLGA